MSDSVKSERWNAAGREAASDGEITLRLLARLPAPEGLEERVHGALKVAPREARVLAWPARVSGGWLRSAAAAAIVCVVGGGGWGIYAHVQPQTQAGRVVSPAVGAPGGFSSAGGMKVPTTVVGPTVSRPSVDEAVHAVVKPAQPAASPMHRSKNGARGKSAATVPSAAAVR